MLLPNSEIESLSIDKFFINLFTASSSKSSWNDIKVSPSITSSPIFLYINIFEPLSNTTSLSTITAVPNFSPNSSVIAAESSNPSSVLSNAILAKVPEFNARFLDSPKELEKDNLS